MTIVLMLAFVACGDDAKYHDFSNEPTGSQLLSANELVYTDSIIGWYTDDGNNLVVAIPLAYGSGANRIEEYYFKPTTNSRGYKSDILVLKLKSVKE
jgi:hypothetical protein